MTDSRFSTVFDTTADLIKVVDLDDVGDIETLLMFLFARPIGIDEVLDDEGAAISLDVIVHGNERSIGCTYDFPMSLTDLARSCAETVCDLGPYIQDQSVRKQSPDVSAMSNGELITALQGALNNARVFKMMDADQGSTRTRTSYNLID